MIKKILIKIGDIVLKYSYYIVLIGFVFTYTMIVIFAPKILTQFITIKFSVSSAFALIIIIQIILILNEIVKLSKNNSNGQ